MNASKRLLGALLALVMLLAAVPGGLATEENTESNGSPDTVVTDTSKTSENIENTGGGDASTNTENTEKTTNEKTATDTGTTEKKEETKVTPSPVPTPVPVPARIQLANANAVASVYKDRSPTTEMGRFSHGTYVTVLERGNVWSYVQIADLKGFIQTAYLNFSVTAPTATPIPDGSYYAYVKAEKSTDLVTLYEKADVNSVKMVSYYSGTRVRVVSEGNGWSGVIVDDHVGYMQSKYLARSQDSNPVGAVSYAIVSNQNPKDKLNLRAKPTTGSTSLGRYPNGTEVKVLEKGSPWSSVEVQGIKGYMMSSYLTFLTSPGVSATPSVTLTPIPYPTTPSGVVHYAVVNNSDPRSKLNLRSEPTIDSQVLGRFGNGTQIKVINLDTIWCGVEVNGLRGYMMTQYLAFTGSSNNNTNNNNNNSGNNTVVAYAVVNNPVATQRLNLRAGASTGTASLGLFYNGTKVTVYDKGTDWCRVVIGSKEGYMMTKYLSFDGTSTSTSPTIGVVKNPVSTQKLNLRAFASKTSVSLGTYYNGTRVSILTYGPTWCYVEVDGKKGYMMTQYLTTM